MHGGSDACRGSRQRHRLSDEAAYHRCEELAPATAKKGIGGLWRCGQRGTCRQHRGRLPQHSPAVGQSSLGTAGSSLLLPEGRPGALARADLSEPRQPRHMPPALGAWRRWGRCARQGRARGQHRHGYCPVWQWTQLVPTKASVSNDRRTPGCPGTQQAAAVMRPSKQERAPGRAPLPQGQGQGQDRAGTCPALGVRGLGMA